MPKFSLLSWNILQDNGIDRAYTISHLQRLQPSAVTVIQEYAFAQAIHAALPNSVVIYREWPDEKIHLEKTPDEWLAARAHQAIDKRMMLYTNNESGSSPKLNSWTVELMDKARARGIRLCVLNDAPGTPHESEWLNGSRDEILTRLTDGWHWLGWHSYTPERELKSSTWRLWLMARFEFVHQRCDTLKIPYPQIAITECGHAEMDGKGGKQGWNKWGLSEGKYARQLIELDTEVMRKYPNVVSVQHFGYGDSGGWDGYDTKRAKALHASLEKHYVDNPVERSVMPIELEPNPPTLPAPEPTPPVIPPPAPTFTLDDVRRIVQEEITAYHARFVAQLLEIK